MKKLIFKKLFRDISLFFIVLSLCLTLIIWVIQAVNFLDFVSEDGHGFRIYFSYTLLNFPKILSRLFCIVFFISVIYVLIKYENNNELILFWTLGIDKIEFVKNLTKFSFFFLIIQILLTLFIVPRTQDLARSYIRSSNIDFFPSLIKEKKFIDTVSDLTIYVNEKNRNKRIMKDIFIKDQISGENFQIIFAKEGSLSNKENKNFLILSEGEIFNHDKNGSTNFSFETFELNLSNYSTKTTTYPKIQELKTNILIRCIQNLYYDSNIDITAEKIKCDKKNSTNINQELFKRIYLPLYIPLITLISCLLILKSKEQKIFNNY
ncbi:LptF/LptG family permease, partial [Candidatus Pelagibacter sp.]|nr:LptF/LptG family permease [Candidatus Pelagibacter sp.]